MTTTPRPPDPFEPNVEPSPEPEQPSFEPARPEEFPMPEPKHYPIHPDIPVQPIHGRI